MHRGRCRVFPTQNQDSIETVDIRGVSQKARLQMVVLMDSTAMSQSVKIRLKYEPA